MTRNLNRQIVVALAALGTLAAFTRYVIERSQEPGGAPWKPLAALAWALLLLAGVWVLTVAVMLGIGDVRSARAARAAWRRPAAGEGSRAPLGVPTGLPMAVRGLQSWGREHRDWFAANGWRPGSAPRPRHAAPMQPTLEMPACETTAEIERPDDGIPAHWRPPVSEPVETTNADVPPSQRDYTIVTTHLQGVAEQLLTPAAWDTWRWEAAA